MPHCILEYSENILEKPDSIDLLTRLNDFVAEKFNIDVRKIKSRLVPRCEFVVSNGQNNQSFIHLEVAIMDGKDKSTHIALSKELHGFLRTEFTKTVNSIACSLTVEVRAMDSDTYVRESFGEM